MTDTTTQKPLRVTDTTAGPYVTLPLTQLDEVKKLLDAQQVFYWVSENAISLDGGPFFIVINFGHNGNVADIQAILDDAR